MVMENDKCKELKFVSLTWNAFIWKLMTLVVRGRKWQDVPVYIFLNVF